MRILHFSNKPIYPLLDGGCIAMENSFNLLKKSEKIQLFHFTISTQKHPIDINLYKEKLQHPFEYSIIDTSINPIAGFLSIFKQTPYNVERFYDEKTKDKLITYLTKNKIGLVFMESLYLLPYLTYIQNLNIKVVVRTHNVEHNLWEERKKIQTNPIKKIALIRMTNQLEKYEKKQLKKVNAILPISDEDAAIFKEMNASVYTLKTTLPTTNKENDYSKNDFYFIGSFDWEPNMHAVEWLISEVIGNKKVDFKIHIAGRKLNPDLWCDIDYIENHGEVNSARNFVLNHGIAIIPLQSGGGVKMKTLEGLALGKPIISSKEGVRGIDFKASTPLIIAEDSERFLNAMLEMYNDETKRKSFGLQGKQFVNDNFDATIEGEKLIEFLQKI